MTLNHSFGDGSLTREQVTWPGSADEVRARIGVLQSEWVKALDGLSDDDYRSTARTRWPIQDREFSDIAGWLKCGADEERRRNRLRPLPVRGQARIARRVVRHHA
jgi:hypothetical protein